MKSFTGELLTLGGDMVLYFFHITCVSTFRFMRLKICFWIEVLFSCIFSIEVFTMFRLDSGQVIVCFLITGLGMWLSSHHSPIVFKTVALYSTQRDDSMQKQSWLINTPTMRIQVTLIKNNHCYCSNTFRRIKEPR